MTQAQTHPQSIDHRREPLTVYELLVAGQGLRDSSHQLPQQVTIRGQSMLAIGVDPGNGEFKAAMMKHDGRLATVDIVACHRQAMTMAAGIVPVTYMINNSPRFWIGQEAVDLKGDALPIGSTASRLGDPRQTEFIVAALVELLIAGGCAPGDHTLAMTLALPNTELRSQTKTTTSGGEIEVVGATEEVRGAIKQHLLNKTFQVQREMDGEVQLWSLTIGHVFTQAQSFGSFLALSHTLYGNRSTKGVREYAFVDMGRGDTHTMHVQLEPTLRMWSERAGDGTIRQARALAAELPGFNLNDAQAQQVLRDRAIIESGRPRSVQDIVETVVERHLQDTFTRLLPTLQNKNAFIVFTGGGTKDPLTLKLIAERMKSVGRSEDTYQVVHPDVASTLNATGALLKTVFTAMVQNQQRA